METQEQQESLIAHRAYRDTVGLFASGVTIITTRVGDCVRGMTANAVTSVSLEPTLLLVCIDRQAHLHDLIAQAGVFAVNILAADQATLSDHFAGRAAKDYTPESLSFVYGPNGDDGGVPTIAGCVAALRCTVEARYPGGDHTIFLGRVTALRANPELPQPLIWFNGTYQHLGPETSAE